LPDLLAWAHNYGIDRNTLGVALFAELATLLIAIIGAVATYIDNYYTTSAGQWVANDLRIRLLRTPPPAFAPVLRQRQDRRADVNYDQRCRDHPKLRVVVNARHTRRPHHHRFHGGVDVLARLELYPDRRNVFPTLG
jgi:hypothetical protein